MSQEYCYPLRYELEIDESRVELQLVVTHTFLVSLHKYGNYMPSVKLGTYLSDLPLAPSLHPNAAHLHHGLGELVAKSQTKQPQDTAGVVPDNPLSVGILPQPLIGLQHALPVPDVLEVAHVEVGPTPRVECHTGGWIAVARADGLELAQEGLVDCRVCIPGGREVVETVPEEQAVCLAYGVCS